MGWRRKRKEDEKGPSGKGQSKKKAVAEVTTQPAAEDIPAADEDAPVEVNRAHGAFFGCYLLSSLNPKKKNSTYIGYVSGWRLHASKALPERHMSTVTLCAGGSGCAQSVRLPFVRPILSALQTDTEGSRPGAFQTEP